LNVIRGGGVRRTAQQQGEDPHLVVDKEHRGATRAFNLQRHHLASLREQPTHPSHTPPLAPRDFHTLLCERIEKAQRRVYLASLYVGPAVDLEKYAQEAQLLQSLSKATRTNDKLNVKILLDQSRGLRPVPLAGSESLPQPKTITSAEACLKVLSTESSSIYLLQVLRPVLQRILPNPLDEVAGVFHIKVYIVDDELILSGANLSEEYFSDRHDRYLHIVRGGNGLVDWYASLVDILCAHADQYVDEQADLKPGKPREGLLAAIRSLLTEQVECEDYDPDAMDRDVVAIACPTFQAPPSWGSDYRSDTQVVVDLLREVGAASERSRTITSTLRLSSAYLNPTTSLQTAFQSFSIVHFLTAGYESHGFRPKKKAGNKGKTWIPAVFDRLARELAHVHRYIWYYSRTGWTFHAKGIWLGCLTGSPDERLQSSTAGQSGVYFPDDEDLLCVSHGSGNFGARSERRDMESNLFLVLPPGSPLIQQHKEEWNAMCAHSVPADEEDKLELQWYLRWLVPLLKPYF
jgi:CDP-diacylglycerol--glycerol-3-phosphate 3-phosphatidyltransferase